MVQVLKKSPLLWQSALLCFVLAALTGGAYRLGIIGISFFDFSLENIRHAHSHLMFFGWASLMPLYIIYALASDDASEGSLGIMRVSLWGVLILSLLSYPFFLGWGYHPVVIGSASLPLSVIVSGLVMISWYAFFAGYLFKGEGNKKAFYRQWVEYAMIMLFLCSLGAWGVAVVQALGLENPLWSKVLTHFFLSTFTEGWIVLVLLGLLVKDLGIKESDFIISPGILSGLIILGAPLTFPYGISEYLMTPLLSLSARAGGFMAGTGLLLIFASILKSGKLRQSLWFWPVLFLGLKSVMQITASLSPALFWLSSYGLRILYLHVLLLGAFSLGLMAFLRTRTSGPGVYFHLVVAAFCMVLVSLILPTGLWPTVLSGSWIFTVMAAVAFVPVPVVLAEWWQLRRAIKKAD